MRGGRLFITGGAGFIGSMLIERLVPENEVAVFDSMSRDALQHREIDPADRARIKIYQGDVTDGDALAAAIADFRPTHVVHCAAIAGIDTVIKSPTSTLRVNILGTANLLDALHRADLDLQRVVLFSTSEVFGQQAFQSAETSSAVIGPVGEARWTYAVSKLADEHFGFAYFKEFGMPTTVVRPFNVYGPGQMGEGALSIFIQRALRNEPIEIHGDGAQIRAWLYVDDMIEGVTRALTMDEAVGESFNIGNSRAVTTIYGLAQTVTRILGSSSTIGFSGRHVADVELRVPDVAKAKDVLGFTAAVSLDEGIPRTAEYYRRFL
jgi:UDP-glucose 4-epimerase